MFTLPNAIQGRLSSTGVTYLVMFQQYSTYQLDLEKMKEFMPKELPNLDEYDIELPLMRYQT